MKHILVKRSAVSSAIISIISKANAPEEGNAEAGFLVLVNEQPLRMVSKKIGVASQYEAQYQALISALEYVLSNKRRASINWKIELSNVLVHSSLTGGEKKVKAPHLVKLENQVRQLAEAIGSVEFVYAP